MTDTINMSAAKPMCNPAASGIRSVNAYKGSPKREIEKKKLSLLGKLKQNRNVNHYLHSLFLFTAQKCF
jgi:hypothetical protein